MNGFKTSMPPSLRNTLAALVSAAATLAVAVPAWAQDSLVIEEITVTAQKREQSLQDVPISITAFSGEDIQENGWTAPVDIIAKTPNVSAYSVFGNAFPIFWIRGIGTSDQAHGANSPVGMYANEIYHSSLVGQGFALFDLERVEVLRGPQGTLWGKNTTGGAMNFISKLPGDELEGNLLAEFGLYNDDTPVYKIEGGVSLPLSETLSARIAVKTHQRDDWVTNQTKNGRGPQTEEGLDGVSEFAGRTTLAWTPSDEFDAVFRATIGRRDGDHVPLHFEAVDNPASFVRHGGYDEDPRIDVLSQDRPSPEKVEYENVSLHMNWNTDWGTVTAISGYIHALYNQDADVDGTPRDGLFGPFEADSEQFSQELRVAWEAGDSADVIVGAYYFTENMDGFNWFLTGSDLGPDAAFAGCCENSGFGNIEQRERNSIALFGSLDYQISDRLALNVGARYTEDEEDWAFQQLFWVFEGSRFNDGVPDSNSAVELFDSGLLSESWDEITGDVSLTYNLSGDVNVYGKYARGYLSGNHVLPFTGTFFSVVEPEQIDSLEFGVKGTYLDGRLQMNAAVFDYSYENVQVSRGTTEPTQGGFISLRENAAEASVRGLELDLTFLPSENWLIRTGVGYTDAEFDQFISILAGGNIDYSGREFPNVPEITAYLDVRYSSPLASGAIVEVATDWNYSDDYFVDLNYFPDNIGESRTLGNLYLRYHSADDRWTASVYARNVTDKEYVVNRRDFSNALEGNLVIYGAPRELGVSLGMNF